MTKLGAGGWALLALRLVVGFGFASHGYAKLERGLDQFVLASAPATPLSIDRWLPRTRLASTRRLD